MFINDEKFVDVLCSYQLTPNQFFLAYLLHKGKLNDLYRYVSSVGTIDDSDIETLEERGFIVNANRVNEEGRLQSFATKYITTSSFLEIIMNHTDIIFDELLDEYPNFILIQGRKTPATNVEKDTAALYIKQIKGSNTKHKQVLELVKWGKENNHISMGISKFIAGKGWEGLAELKGKTEDTGKRREGFYNL